MEKVITNSYSTARTMFAAIFFTVLLTTQAFGQTPGKLQRPLLDIKPSLRLPAGQKSPLQNKIDFELLELRHEHILWVQQRTDDLFRPQNSRLPIRGKENLVIIDATAQSDTQALATDLQRLGCTKIQSHKRMVSARCPIKAIDKMAQLSSLNFVRPATSNKNVGSITSQGDVAMRADIARTDFSVNGSGILVGTLSDSYDCLSGAAADVLSGDLPSGVNVLDDSACAATDEGRGMMQLIADVAPGAAQAFHTAFNGQAAFASGIMDLQGLGADIINDDIFYFAEPFFQDGIIAQAVDTVKNSGVAYFSSAGNSGRVSYESNFRQSGQFEAIFGGELHNFNPSGGGVDIYQQITLPVGNTTFSFQWAEPYFVVSGAPGSASDYDIFLCLSDTDPVDMTNCPIGGATDNIGSDPIEVIQPNITGSSLTLYVAISRFTGTSNDFLKYIVFRDSVSIDEHDTASNTSTGHANAAGAEAVGAAFYARTPEFLTPTPFLNDFSSAGGTPILFDLSGNPIVELRLKPEIVAPDGTNTTFFGSDISDPGDGSDLDSFPNFFGTSAAAPHAAAVAALMLEAAGGSGSLTPDEIYTAMESTAIDIVRRSPSGIDNLPVGFDFDSGFGLIQADAAILAVSGSLCNGDFDGDGDVDGSDLGLFNNDFGRTDCTIVTPCNGDFDNDGDVDGTDLGLFNTDFGRTDCPIP